MPEASFTLQCFEIIAAVFDQFPEEGGFVCLLVAVFVLFVLVVTGCGGVGLEPGEVEIGI